MQRSRCWHAGCLLKGSCRCVCSGLGAGLLAACERGLVGYVCSGLGAGLLAACIRGLVGCVCSGLGAGLLAACARGMEGDVVCGGLGAGLLAACSRGMEGDVCGGLVYICETGLNRHVSSGLGSGLLAAYAGAWKEMYSRMSYNLSTFVRLTTDPLPKKFNCWYFARG